MLQTIEGIYKNRKIQLTEIPPNISDSQILITFLGKVPLINNHTELKSSKMIYFGMFSGKNKSTEADFQKAEFDGDFDDNLDWQLSK